MPRRPSSHVDSAAAVGRRLKAARLAAGLTQRELSFPGCTPAYISRIEAGARIPSFQILREFGRRLGVSAEYLAGGGEEQLPADELVEADIALRLGDLERAERLYERVRDAAAEPGPAARAEAGLGRLALLRGDAAEAAQRLEQVLERRLPETEATAAASALGRAYAEEGRLAEAADVFRRSLEAARSRDDRLSALRFATLLAEALLDAREPAQAEEALTDAAGLAREALDPRRRPALYWEQSQRSAARGQPEAAARFVRLTVAVLEDGEHALAAAGALLLLARFANDRGEAEEALALLDEAEPGLRAAGSEVDRVRAVLERARALDRLGSGAEADQLVLGALGVLQHASSPAAGRAAAAAGDVLRGRGDHERALELYASAVERLPA